MSELVTVLFGETQVAIPASLGVLNDFQASAEALRKEIAASTEFDASLKRGQLADLDRVVAQIQARLDTQEAELYGHEQQTMPPGVFRGGNGLYFLHVDGVTCAACEDCWQAIPSYVDFPNGLVSPESDGDAGGNFVKRRRFMVEGKVGEWRPGKVVCLPCYLAAFSRVYPHADVPDLSATIRKEVMRVPATTELEACVSVPEPKT